MSAGVTNQREVATYSRSLRARRSIVVLTVVAVMAGACSTDEPARTGGRAEGFDVKDWSSVLAAARGQTVDWWIFGGDERVNTFVNGYIKDELAKLGVTLNAVKYNDTVEAVNKALGERQAGRTTDGSIDLMWINGENFKTAKQADLLECGHVRSLPNAKYLNFEDPAVTSDFGLPVEDCEAPWIRAQSVVVYDSAKVRAADIHSVDALFAYVKDHPGSFGYSAPPELSGSMALRTFFIAKAGGYRNVAGAFDRAVYDRTAPALWRALNDLEPYLWRGSNYTARQADVIRAYGQGEVSMYITYGAGGVGLSAQNGTFPASTRELEFDSGNLGNISFTAIPKNAADKAGALVLSDLLLSPAAQYEIQKASGLFPAIDVNRTAPADAAKFATIPTPPAQLPFADLMKNSVPEIQAEWVTMLERDWKANVQEK